MTEILIATNFVAAGVAIGLGVFMAEPLPIMLAVPSLCLSVWAVFKVAGK